MEEIIMNEKKMAIELLNTIQKLLVDNNRKEFCELPKKVKIDVYDEILHYADNVDGHVFDSIDAYLRFNDIDTCINVSYVGEYPYDPDSIGNMRFWNLEDDSDVIKFDDKEETTLSMINRLLDVMTVEHEHKFINLTPHEFNLYNANNELILTVPSSGTCRVLEKIQEQEPINGIPVNSINYSGVEGLPDAEPHTYYIVSLMVLQALNGRRPDCVAPNSGGDAVRENGRILGTRSFTTI